MCVLQSYFPSGKAGVSQAHYPLRAKQVICDWFMIPFLWEHEVIKSWLGDIDLAESNPFGASRFVFNTYNVEPETT